MNHELAERARRNVEGAEGEEQRVKRARAEEKKKDEEDKQEAVNKRKAEEEPSEEPPHKYQQVNEEEEQEDVRQDEEMKNEAEDGDALMNVTKELYGAETVTEEVNTGTIRRYDKINWMDRKEIEKVKHEAKYRKSVVAMLQACGRNSGKLGEPRKRERERHKC